MRGSGLAPAPGYRPILCDHDIYPYITLADRHLRDNLTVKTYTGKKERSSIHLDEPRQEPVVVALSPAKPPVGGIEGKAWDKDEDILSPE